MPTSAVRTYTGANRVIPIKDPDDIDQDVLTLVDDTYLAGQLLGQRVGSNEVQRITITGTPTSGTFTITYAGQTTAAIAYNATAAAVAAALELLSTIGLGGVKGSGGPFPGTAVDITFQGQLGARNVAAMTTTDSFGGGSAPASAVTTPTGGVLGDRKYAKYTHNGTDGTQHPTHILEYGCVVTSGRVAIGDQATMEWGQTELGAPAYKAGEFSCADLVGLDQYAIDDGRCRLLEGTVDAGRVLWLGGA